MSRMSISTFLVIAKRHLQQTIHNKGTASFVVGNESADLDSITCALVYGYIQSMHARRSNHVVIPVTNIPAADLSLRPELTALLQHAGLKPDELITLDDLGDLPMPLSKTDWTLVDHNALTGPLSTHYANSIIGVIDHHSDENSVPSSADPRLISESAGSCNSLLTNYLRPTWDDLGFLSTSGGGPVADDGAAYSASTWGAQTARLALGSILIDTHNLTDESKVTEHDRKAVRYLEAKINALHYDRTKFFEEISAAKSDLDGLSLTDVLRKDYKQWTEGTGMRLGMSSVVKSVEWLQGKAEHAGDFTQTLVEFAKERELHLFAVMTAYTAESGDFARQLLLIAVDEEGAQQVVKKFVQQATEELQLEPSQATSSQDGEGRVPYLQLWTQKNVAASRKRVGPLIREAMR